MKEFIRLVFLCFFAWLLVLVLGVSEGYKMGQLDFQEGKIKYELTDTGYKEIIKK